MKSYWSYSKFADWLRGTPNPLPDTMEGWDAWRKEAAKNHKIRYWIAEKGLDYLQNILFSPFILTNSIRCYIRNRWIDHTHALTSNLKRGAWHDLDYRLLYAIFDELVNFVEIELASMIIVLPDEERAQYKIKKYWFRHWRSSDAGIAYLNWVLQQTFDEYLAKKDDPKFGQPTPHALAAIEISILYHWWKIDRPKRPDPSDESGWTAYCIEQENEAKARGDDPLLGIFSRETSEKKRKIMESDQAIEKAQEDEDTDMLIRLIKVRRFLWT